MGSGDPLHHQTPSPKPPLSRARDSSPGKKARLVRIFIGGDIIRVGDAGGPFAGLVLPGTGSVSNGQCTISGTGSSVNAGGNNLTLNLNIAFNAAFAGNKIVYLAARDVSQANNTDWHAVGTWTVQ